LIRAVLDANVILSGMAGYAKAESVPGEILRRFVFGECILVTSPPIANEVRRNLGKDFLRRSLPDEELAELMSAVFRGAEFVPLTRTVSGLASHPEDDLVLATVANGETSHLVTGDRQLIALESFEGADVSTPRAFLDILATQNWGVDRP
jgi:putative PIN family toxin of toxin-antitoxin system